MSPRRDADHYGHIGPARDDLAGLSLFDGTAARKIEEPVRRVEVRAHMRQVSGESAPSGRAKKDEALEAHELDAAKRRAIQYLREQLAILYRSRCADRVRWPIPYVNGDDCARLFREWAQHPTALDSVGGYWRGAVFRRGFQQIPGLSHPSLREDLNGTAMPAWRAL